MQSILKEWSQSNFVGIIRQVDEYTEDEQNNVSSSGMKKLMHNINKQEVRQILQEYTDIFLRIYHPEFLQGGWGTNLEST